MHTALALALIMLGVRKIDVESPVERKQSAVSLSQLRSQQTPSPLRGEGWGEGSVHPSSFRLHPSAITRSARVSRPRRSADRRSPTTSRDGDLRSLTCGVGRPAHSRRSRLYAHWESYYGFVPNMLGDFLGEISYGPGPAPNTQPRAIGRTLPRYKVADNNSPIPRNRLLYSYNYFQNPFDTDGNVHRNFFGIELAFLGQMFSIEIKTSVNSFGNFSGAVDETEIGDLRTTFKALLLQNDSSAIAVGMAVGWPMGDAPDGLSEYDYLLAPYVGLLWAPVGSNWFVQGMQQLDIPTAIQDVNLLHSDLQVGYYLLRSDGSSVAIIPTIELHRYTPISKAGGAYQQVNYDNVLNATLGTTFFLRNSFTIAIGIGFPISSNRDYDVETQIHLNWLFGGARGAR